MAIAKARNFATSWAFVSLVVCACVLGCGGPPKHPSWSNATGAEQHERLMWQSLRQADWKNVQYHLAPAFVGVDPNGQAFDRAGWVEYWKTRPIREFSLAEVLVQPEGTDLVITYVLRLELASPAGASVRSLRVVSVWQQVKTRWILTVTSATAIAGA